MLELLFPSLGFLDFAVNSMQLQFRKGKNFVTPQAPNSNRRPGCPVSASRHPPAAASGVMRGTDDSDVQWVRREEWKAPNEIEINHGRVSWHARSRLGCSELLAEESHHQPVKFPMEGGAIKVRRIVANPWHCLRQCLTTRRKEPKVAGLCYVVRFWRRRQF